MRTEQEIKSIINGLKNTIPEAIVDGDESVATLIINEIEVLEWVIGSSSPIKDLKYKLLTAIGERVPEKPKASNDEKRFEDFIKTIFSKV